MDKDRSETRPQKKPILLRGIGVFLLSFFGFLVSNLIFYHWLWREPRSMLHDVLSALFLAVWMAFLAPLVLRSWLK
jgi:hypothetical protein